MSCCGSHYPLPRRCGDVARSRFVTPLHVQGGYVLVVVSVLLWCLSFPTAFLFILSPWSSSCARPQLSGTVLYKLKLGDHSKDVWFFAVLRLGWLGPFWSSKGEVGSVFTMWWAQCPACSPRRLRLHMGVQFGFRGRVESVFTMRWAQGPVGFSPTSSLSSGRTVWFSRRGVESVFTVWWARGTAGFPQTLPLEVDVHQFWNSSCLHGRGVESVFTVGWAPGTPNVFTFGWALPCHEKRAFLWSVPCERRHCCSHGSSEIRK